MNCSGFSTVFVVSGGIRIQAQPGGPASGDLTGSYDGVLGPIVHRIQSQSVDPRVPNNGDTFVFNGGEWIPTPTPTNTATVFRGTWDANANTPDISISPSNGDSWIVTVAGNTNLGGITGWIVGDYAVYSNGNWYKLSNQSFGWTLTGNNGTNSNINFIGTADEHDLSIRANSLEGFRIFTDGNSRAAGSLNVVGNLTASNAHFSGDVKINGGDVTTSATLFNLLNSVATTINFGSAASTCLKMGNSAGHTIISGSVKIPNGLSGSLTRLTDGSSYLREGLGTLIESGTNGHVTIGVKDSVFATISGSTFTGPVLFNAGLSGSLTALVDGTPYLKSGVNVVISTASNGSITVATPAAGADTQVQFNDGGTLFGATAGFTFNKSTSNVLIGGDLAVNGGDITTTQSTATVFDTNATTVNIGAAATAMNVGSAAGTVTLRGDLAVNGGDITTNQTTATVFNTTATTVSIAGGATTGVNIGNPVATNVIQGTTRFNQGLSGSLTHLTDGTSYAISGQNISITTGSSGAITVALTGIVPVANGGTGLSSSPANGQILVGNGTGYTSTTITQGTGISIANGAGSITVSNAGTLSVGATAPIASSGGQNPTISLNDSGVVAGTYGQADSVSRFAVTSKGLITNASNVPIAISASQVVSGTFPSTVSVQNIYQNVTAQIGGGGGALAFGEVVFFTTSGGSATNPAVDRVVASNIANASVTIGLVSSTTIANGTAGQIVTRGVLVGNPLGSPPYLNTNSFTQGDLLYVDPTTPGALTNVKPSYPNFAIPVGIVIVKNQFAGAIYVGPSIGVNTADIVKIPSPSAKVNLSAPATTTISSTLFNGPPAISYLALDFTGAGNVTLSTGPIQALTANDYGRVLWIHNISTTKTVTFNSGGTALLSGGVNLVLQPNSLVQFMWSFVGSGGAGRWLQMGAPITVT